MNTPSPVLSALASTDNIPAIIAVAREAGAAAVNRPTIEIIEDRSCLVQLNGVITPLVLAEKHLDTPRRKRARVSFYEEASFSDYILRHRIPGATHLFGVATETAAGFTAILDYHGTGDGKPAFGEHQAALKLEITPEWARWIAQNSKFMSQQAFAEHIEDNLLDIIDPEPATLLEVAQGLQGMKNVAFKSGRNLRDGAIKLEYVETIEVSGTTSRRDASFQVPEKFTIQVVPFVGANGVEIEARLRFRVGQDGGLSFAYILNRPYKVIEAAFNATREDIEKATGIKVLLGTGAITPIPAS
jgi:uncharacterized protein YfdQ (DUF2303 family)